VGKPLRICLINVWSGVVAAIQDQNRNRPLVSTTVDPVHDTQGGKRVHQPFSGAEEMGFSDSKEAGHRTHAAGHGAFAQPDDMVNTFFAL
jgi:hypothetical protein